MQDLTEDTVVNDIANSTDELSALNAAREYEVALNYVYILCRLGRLEGARKIDGVWRIPRRALQERLGSRREAATA